VATFDVQDSLVTCLQADPLIEIADLILEHASRDFITVDDGIVTFHCTNGDLTYGLREHDDIRETWIGVRSGVADAEGNEL
jgi:hypothetical protein